MKKILVPTDFSKTANKARDYAVQLAEAFDAELILMHAWHIPFTGSGTGTMINMDTVMSQNAHQMLEKQCKVLKALHPKLKLSTVNMPALMVDGIQQLCEKDEIDWVVMGTTGASGFPDKLIGSNTSHLIGKIDVPIIAVPQDGNWKTIDNIAVAIDLLQVIDENSFRPLKKLARKFNAHLDFVHIIEGDGPSRKDRKVAAANFDQVFDHEYHQFHYKENEDVEEGILDYIGDKKIDILAVKTGERNFWEELLHKSMTKSLVRQASLPILVLP